MNIAVVRVALAVLYLGLAVSCVDFSAPSNPTGLERGEITTTSGVKFEDTFLGNGPAAVVGDEVVFDYTLWLESGVRVDSTMDRGYAVRIVLGSAPLKGWNDGLLGIQSQGDRRITIPPELAYGAEGIPGLIPPNAVLIFEVHVIELMHPKK